MKTVYERADVVSLLTEVFRELGYEGTTLSRIAERTGLGKGSLYHFFPGGKEEMAAAVLAHIDGWFERSLYQPLREDEPAAAIDTMWRNVDTYFHSGGRVCLVGVFALDGTRDKFAAAISSYFQRWIASLGSALIRSGMAEDRALEAAEEAVAGIQGGLVLARALDDTAVFTRTLAKLQNDLGHAATERLRQ